MKSYEELGQDIGKLVTKKQAAYGDSFGKSGDIMRILYPDGISIDKLDDALTVVRVVDKLFRIATDRDALGESPWQDIAGYSILSLRRLQVVPVPSLVPGTPEKAARLEEALQKLALEITSQETVCRLCDTVTDFKEGEVKSRHKHRHDPKCILYTEGA